MRAALALLLALQAGSTPVTFVWTREAGQEGMFFEVETPGGIVPCDRIRVEPTEMRCTATLALSGPMTVRLRAALLPNCSASAGLCCDQSEVACQSPWSSPVTVSAPAGDIPGQTTVIRIR